MKSRKAIASPNHLPAEAVIRTLQTDMHFSLVRASLTVIPPSNLLYLARFPSEQTRPT